MIYRARFVVTMDGPPIPWGSLRVHEDKITQVGGQGEVEPQPGEPVIEIDDAILMPGLINAHCHLELGMARGVLPAGEPLPMWVSRLRKTLEGATPENYRQAVRLGALECLKNGITTVVDVGNSGEALRELATLPIRSYPYLELLGLDPDQAEEKMRVAAAMLRDIVHGPDRFHPGMTCHAPYSCSVDLLKKVLQAEEMRKGPFTMHVSESREEMSMFREGKGALLDFCLRIFPALSERRYHSPIRFLKDHGLMPTGALFAHCNIVDAEDIRILAEAETSVVHCPKSHAFFKHPEFPLHALREAGVNLCLGTDSLGSCDSLSLFDEMAHLHNTHTDFSCQEILAMATTHPARALGQSGSLGRLRTGAKADFIAIGLRHHPEYDLYEEIVSEAHEVLLVAVDGEEVVS